jgi:hypothetical protein
MSNVVHFPAGTPPRKPHRAEYRSRTGDGQKNMHTYLFRSREALLEADEAELIRDVCCDLDKAQKKLQKIREQIEGLQEYATIELQSLTTADIKLSAAIVAALLSTREGKSGGS